MRSTSSSHKQLFKQLHACVIMATYNNRNTLQRVLDAVLEYCDDVIVVNDGSTDDTPQILQQYANRITLVNHAQNSGKGMALRNGFKKATELGFEYAVTIDSDGQHYPDDIPVMLNAMQQHPGAVIMGSRNMAQAGVPGKSSFGNKFSNFWFKVETGIELPDTQTGFRVYPLNEVKHLRLFTTKFELEIEVIVKLAWRGVEFVPVPVKVKYDPAERVSHFRPFRDFTRISILNTWFFILTLLYYLPKRLAGSFRKKGIIQSIKDELFNPEEDAFKKAMSVGVGVFIGIFPIWGFQIVTAFIVAFLFRLNKVLVVGSSNVSITPMIPPIIFASYVIGGFFVEHKVAFHSLGEINLQSIHLNVIQYIIGSTILAAGAGLLAFILTLLLSQLYLKPKKT